MFLLIGLGNPGSQYAAHRHNVGFMMIEHIASFYNFSSFHKRGQTELAEGIIQGEKCLALKPQSYMNLSGQAIVPLVQLYKISLSHILVIHDDIDLPLGSVRCKQGGGSGGHNGLKNLDAHIGRDYWRLRIGVGHPGDPNLVSQYVLSNFKPAERQVLESFCIDIPPLIGLWVSDKIEELKKQVADLKIHKNS